MSDMLEAIETMDNVLDEVDSQMGEIKDPRAITWKGSFWELERDELLMLLVSISKISHTADLILHFAQNKDHVKIFSGNDKYYIEKDFRIKNSDYYKSENFNIRFDDFFVLVKVYVNFVIGFDQGEVYFYNNFVNVKFSREHTTLFSLSLPADLRRVVLDKKLFTFFKAMMDNSIRTMDNKMYFGLDIRGFHYLYSYAVKGAQSIFQNLWLQQCEINLLLTLVAEDDIFFYTTQGGRVYIKFPNGFLSFIELKQQTKEVGSLWSGKESERKVNFLIPILKKALTVLSTFGANIIKLCSDRGKLVLKSGDGYPWQFIVGSVDASDMDMDLNLFRKVIDIATVMSEDVYAEMYVDGLMFCWQYKGMSFELQLPRQSALVIG